MAAAEVDLAYLAGHLGLPETNLSTVATDPTVELVNAVLSAIAAKAYEYDALYTRNIELEVGYETSVRGAEAQRDASNENAKKALRDVEEIRHKLQEEEAVRQSLENELQSIKSSCSTSQSEIDTLRTRIASLETSNRESLAIIDTKNSANDTLSQELQAQHQKNLKLNQEIANLQQTVQNANNAANTSKFREQSLQQQLDMAQRNAEFFQNELKTKAAEATRYRTEKGARITELQRLNDDAVSNVESLKRTEQSLRQRLEDAQKKVDESLTKIQQLEEAAGRREEDFRQESDGLKRLVDLKDQQTVTHKNRIQEVEAREEQVRRECEDRVRRVSEELARANLDKEDLAQTIGSLQAEVGRLEAIIAGTSQGHPGSVPQTPRPLNGSVYRPGSPFQTPGSSRKSLTATQALEDFYKIKGQLTAEKQRSNNLAKELDDVIEQLEAKGPELEELHAENERLQQEIKNMSHLSDESFRERDQAKKAARRAESSLSQAQAQVNILQNQIRDCSAQIQMLVFNMHCREKGMDELTIEEALHLQKLEKGHFDGNTSDQASDVNTMILERLVVFKDIQELQEKNEHLLKVTHELGQKMEDEEAIAAKKQAVEDHKERLRLQQELEVFKDTLRGFQIKADSITKERDMFRRIVENRTSADELASALGHQAQDGVLASIEQNSTMNDDTSEYTSLLRDLQQNFDLYRNEQTVDRKTIKEQVEKLSLERNSLQTEVSRLSSQLSLASERYEMLQSNFAALQVENKELQIRNQSMSENATKQDIRTQQVAEDLIEARGLVESMRSESANLKAEKKLWKDIQDRLSQDNENLVQEKSRLNSLLATQQTLQNERELNEAEAKRRLQSQIDTLESDLSTTKRKLTDETEEAKKAQLRKEFDSQQTQKRTNELTATLSQIREELVGTKTSRDHLQTRVDELTIQLRSAEERTERLQPRPTPRPASTIAGGEQTADNLDTDNRIQDLIHEVTDLKRDLEMAQSQLENAQSQVDKYKEMSQGFEEELERLNAAHEQYVQEMDTTWNNKDATIKALEQRAEDLSVELSRSNSELSSLRDSQAEVTRRFEDEKAILDGEIKRLKEEEEQYSASSQFHQQDLRAQAEIATNAQQSYEDEVVKHGVTARTLSTVRQEYNKLKSDVASLRADAESSRATLLQSESSWEDRRQRFERELSELRARRDDANAQNKLLHEQLDNVSQQISALQQSRVSTDDSLEAISAQPSDSQADKYREISNYLRREKEILEVQYELKVKDAGRLQQQLEYTQSQLDETRLKLEQERQSSGQSERTSLAHKDLMSKLEELNLFRESSAALRTEARQAQSQLTEKIARVSELESSIQPLEAQIEELQSQMTFKETEIKQVHEDRDRWQKRTEDILSKHGRTDPGEIEELKQAVTKLESEKDALQQAETPLKERITELEKSIEEKEAAWNVLRERLIQSAKDRSKTLNLAKNEVIGERDQLQVKLNEANRDLATIREELETSKSQKVSFEEQVTNLNLQVQTLQEEAQARTGTAASEPTEPSDNQAISDLQNQLLGVRTELQNVSTEKVVVEQELQNIRGQLDSAIADRDQALSQAQAQVQSGTTNGDAPVETNERETFDKPAATLLSDDERKVLEDRITAAEARAAEWEAKARELEERQETIVKARSDKMKEHLNKRLQEYKATMETERSQMLQDKQKLEADFQLRLEQERKIWEAENPTARNETKPPSTPQQPKPEPSDTTTPSAATPDVNNLSDKDVRDLVSTHPTIKSIVQNNIRNKLATEAKKIREEQETAMKAEWEQKLLQARESAAQLATSKANLKLNMSENRSRVAQAKLGVVENAAKETPTRPVGEVWEIAKDAKPPPPPTPVKQVAPAPTAAANPSATPANQQPAMLTNSSSAQGSGPTAVGTLPQPSQLPSNLANTGNPFATSQQSQLQQAAPAANPFAAQSNQASSQQAAPTGIPQTGAPANISSLPQKVSGIPLPGGVRKPSGPNQPRGGARGGAAHRGGRGGAQQGRVSLNPDVENFQPGNKRPRGDSEVGNGSKRPRGGGPQ